jgi:hypothetical protein
MLQEVYVGLVFSQIRGPHRSAVLAAAVRQQQLGLSKGQRRDGAERWDVQLVHDCSVRPLQYFCGGHCQC